MQLQAQLQKLLQQKILKLITARKANFSFISPAIHLMSSIKLEFELIDL